MRSGELEQDWMKTEEPNIPETAESEKRSQTSFESRPGLTGRRAFFARLAEVVAASVAVLFAIPFVRYLLYPFFAISARFGWSNLGPADQFTSGATPVARWVTVTEKDGWLQSESKRAVYVTKDAHGRVEVLSAVCPHLGCTVQWRGSKNEFVCPCHGSIFAPDGARIAGPAPRGMDSLPITVQDGQLMVQYEDFQQLLPTKQILD
jgi:quinol---cytochrome c reductase iron-sulfur subunit, bacillus type